MPQVARNRKGTGRRIKRRDFRAPVLVVFIAFAVFMLLLCPLKPVEQAMNAEGSGSGRYKGLVISEIMSSNKSAFPDENGSFCDWIEITNTTAEPISLENITLSNRPDKAKFIFPAQLLQPGESVIVYCNDYNQNELGKAYRAKFKLSSLGTHVYMFNPSGLAIESVEVPTLNANESYARMEDGSFEITDQFSPGYPNTEEGHVQYLAQYTIQADTLRINEIMAAPRSGLRDEDGDLSDWVELYNAG